MNYAIIGTGFIFRKHLQAVQGIGGVVIDVCDITHGRGEEWKKIVKNPAADCIVILAPNYLHYPIAMAAADEGKLALVEKPLALKSEQVAELAKKKNIFVVQQLRYHPEIKRLEKEVDKNKHHDIIMDISVYRDDHYFNGWKGKMEMPGGPLFTLGVHYFELLLHLFGPVLEAKMDKFDGKTGKGLIKGANYDCQWRVSVGAKIDEPWKREFIIDGQAINLSSKENLAEENLHQFVYRDLEKKQGVTPNDVLPVVKLIEKLYESCT